jgi:hypothetical protein
MMKSPQEGFVLNRKSQFLSKFVTARSLLGIHSGIPLLDSLIGGLKHDTIALIAGTHLRLVAAERYAVRAQLPERRGGLSATTFFIDGGNSFDVYLFASIAREYGLDIKRALGRLTISRAFTVYELQQLVREDSKSVLQGRQRRPGLLIVSDVFSLFNEDVEKAEARAILKGLKSAITSISSLEHVPILLTSAPKTREQLQRLGDSIIEDSCNIVAEITEGPTQLRARLLKHPSRKPREVTVEVSPFWGRNQESLLACQQQVESVG